MWDLRERCPSFNLWHVLNRIKIKKAHNFMEFFHKIMDLYMFMKRRLFYKFNWLILLHI